MVNAIQKQWKGFQDLWKASNLLHGLIELKKFLVCVG